MTGFLKLKMEAPESPTQPPPQLSILASSIIAGTQSLLDQSSKLRDNIAAQVSVENATFENVVQPLIDNANRTACRLNILGGLLAEAAPESTVRSAAREAQILILEANTAQLMRQDIADLIRAVHQSADSGSRLDAEDKHLLNHMYREIKRSGATLQNEEARNRLKEVKAEIDQLQLAAVKTLTDDDTGGLWFSGDELLGMSPKVLDSLDTRKATPKNGAEVSEYFTTFKDSVRSQMASSVRHAGARRTYAVGARRRFPENASRLAKLVVLRDEMARILGFDNYADMRMEELMAGNIGDVLDTLRRMVEKLKPLADAENDMLLNLKHHENSDEQDKQFTCINDWDWSFYAKKFRAQNQNGGAEAVKEYFEVHHTWNGTLTLFEELFRIRFKDITGSTSVWHDSVKTYSLWNDTSKDEGSFLGYLYVDLFEREGKYQNQRHVLIEPVSRVMMKKKKASQRKRIKLQVDTGFYRVL